jgi:hypothetical protein
MKRGHDSGFCRLGGYDILNISGSGREEDQQFAVSRFSMFPDLLCFNYK